MPCLNSCLARNPRQVCRFRPSSSIGTLSFVPRILLRRTADQAEAFLHLLLSVSCLQKIHFLWRLALPDPDDDLFLELPVAARCANIITHNIRDFRGAEKLGVSVSPSDFLRKIKAKT